MNPLSKLLNLHKQEKNVVNLLLLFQLLQGAAIALYVTIASAVFVVKLGVGQLPFAFIITAIFLWITALIHIQLESKISSNKLNNVLLVFITLVIITGFFFLEYFNSNSLLFLMFILYPVLLLLNNLKLWSIATMLFDARESKKLNDIVSVADIPAKFIGYALAAILAGYLSPGQIFEVAAVLVLLSFFPLQWIRKYKLMNQSIYKHHVEQSNKRQLKKFISLFLNNKLVMNLALLSFIIYVVTIIVNYEFLGIVTESFTDVNKVAIIIGLTMASGKLVSFLFRLIFSDKILLTHGGNRLLALTPVIMAIFAVAICCISFFTSSGIYMVIVFGAMFSLADVLRNATFTPALLNMIQPLTIHERFRAQTIIKGSMEPFAYLLCGLVLMLAWFAAGDQSYFLIAFIIVLLVVIWVNTAKAAAFQYCQSVVNGGELTLFTNREFSVRDKETLRLVENKILSGDAVQVAHLLELLAGDANDETRKIILGGLKHTSYQVRIIASNLSDNLKIKEAVSSLKDIATVAKNVDLKQAALKAVCNISMDDSYVMPFIDSENELLRITALIGILQNGNDQSKSAAEKMLDEMIQSDDVPKRLAAVTILKQLNSGIYIKQLLKLINDKDKKVADEAMLAAGKNASENAIEAIVSKIETNEQAVLDALQNAGPIALPYIKSFVLSKSADEKHNKQLVHLCGRIGGSEAIDVLLNFAEENATLKNTCLKALYSCGFVATGRQKQLIEKLIHEYMQSAVDLSNMMNQLAASGHNFTLLRNALKIELGSIRMNLLVLYSFLFDKNLISRAATGFTIGSKESESNALEAIENAVPKNFATPFRVLFGGQTSKSLTKLRDYPSSLPSKIEELIDIILNNKNYLFNDWTKACAMYECRLNIIDVSETNINRMLKSNNPLLIETADFAA